ncbi:transmembrane sensor [Pedobacter africanus]|uniref:Ferric-dicitrate binding protein FerR (Iron transport regulator) n=1 Tax=Pedobacter africanus TaxID=151894 RepID=A0ACC6L2I9_9SPHI|nr:FecR domain-containing protein [Pedobacter africanus]MDR6785706.1 ferric-dicitrate binding protein FerR (iron transport regulator) [Pedobacter africanus]
MQEKEIKVILDKYKNGTATAEEKALLESWYLVHQEPEPYEFKIEERAKDLDTVLTNLDNAYYKNKRTKFWPRIGTAAAVIGLAIGIYFYTSPHPEGNGATKDLYANDIAPGKNTATLSLAGGKAITLSDAHTGVIIDASQIKYNDGSLVKSASGAHNEMTVTTPRGGTYQITLPDGTKVWLNAASSLTYHMPLKERGGVRKVELSGEAYFEVFRNKLQPFVVNSKKMELTVLGTHFNVNAYNDETNIKATLLEGSVRVTSSGRNIPPVTLKPNQQAVVKESGIDCILVDAEDAIAWKNSLFAFDNEPLESILRKVARWYDVQVVYADDQVAKQRFSGSVSRFSNVSSLLEKLENTGPVKFEIKNKTITAKKIIK